MPSLTIRGVEHVYDAFDTYEHANPVHLAVDGMDPHEAVARGRELLQAKIDTERRAGGFLSSGMFLVELTQVEDESGLIYYRDLAPVRGSLRYFGADLEDYRDVAASFVFLSYSHRDAGFTDRLKSEIEVRGLRLWYDKDDFATECTLLRFGPTDPEKTLAALGRAIDRAKCLLLVLSRHSISSRWVQEELRLALDANPGRQIPVAALLLESDVLSNAPAWVTDNVSRFRQFDFSAWLATPSLDPLPELLLEVFRFRGMPLSTG